MEVHKNQLDCHFLVSMKKENVWRKIYQKTSQKCPFYNSTFHRRTIGGTVGAGIPN